MNGHKSQVDNNELKKEELIQIALRRGAGVVDVVAISPSDIPVEDDLANMCREPKCTFYGLSDNCPPNVGGPSRFRDLLKICDFVLAIKIDVSRGCLITDERLVIMKLLHEIVADIEKSAIELGYCNSKAFAVASCKELFCNEYLKCRVLNDGGECRHQQYARPSIEANGVNVHELNKIAGWTHKQSMEAVYGLVLIG
jgi:predicted metal-binding protein